VLEGVGVAWLTASVAILRSPIGLERSQIRIFADFLGDVMLALGI
jgi:hypothetical protein